MKNNTNITKSALEKPVSRSRRRENIQMIRASHVNKVAVNWLFYPFIARGEATILSADPGSGKTLMALWIAARVSRGLDFPVHQIMNTPGNASVCYLSREDRYDTTIIPRFLACGGDPDNLFFPAERDMPESFKDRRMENIFRIKPDLIIFDAVSSFFGDANMNQANEVRKSLSPLLTKARKSGTALLLIAHNNKMGSIHNAQYRVSGSVDFTAFVRSGLVVGRVAGLLSEDPDDFVLAQFKNNLESLGESLRFQMVITEESQVGLEFTGTTDISSTELIKQASEGRENSKVSQAMGILENILNENDGFIPVRDLEEKIAGLNISAATVYRARKALKLKSVKIRDKESGRYINVLAYSNVEIPVQDSFLDSEKAVDTDVSKF